MSSTKSKGQPTKYKPEYCAMLVEHMKTVNSFETFGCEVNVCADTLYEWCKVHKDFSEAKKMGRLHLQKGLENLGKGLMSGKVKGNVAAWIFYSKNTVGWNDDGVAKGDEESNDWEFSE